VKLCTDNWR